MNPPESKDSRASFVIKGLAARKDSLAEALSLGVMQESDTISERLSAWNWPGSSLKEDNISDSHELADEAGREEEINTVLPPPISVPLSRNRLAVDQFFISSLIGFLPDAHTFPSDSLLTQADLAQVTGAPEFSSNVTISDSVIESPSIDAMEESVAVSFLASSVFGGKPASAWSVTASGYTRQADKSGQDSSVKKKKLRLSLSNIVPLERWKEENFLSQKEEKIAIEPFFVDVPSVFLSPRERLEISPEISPEFSEDSAASENSSSLPIPPALVPLEGQGGLPLMRNKTLLPTLWARMKKFSLSFKQAPTQDNIQSRKKESGALWFMIWRREILRAMIVTTSLMMAGLIVWIWQAPTRYTASALVTVDRPPQRGSLTESVSSVTDPALLAAMIELTAPKMSIKTIAVLDLHQNPAFNPLLSKIDADPSDSKIMPEQFYTRERQILIEKFHAGLTVTAHAEAPIINVSVRAAEPMLAAQITDTLILSWLDERQSIAYEVPSARILSDVRVPNKADWPVSLEIFLFSLLASMGFGFVLGVWRILRTERID